MGLKRQIQIQEVIKNDKKKNKNAETTSASLTDIYSCFIVMIPRKGHNQEAQAG